MHITHLPAVWYLFLLAAQDIHRDTYVPDYIVGHNNTESHQVDGVPLSLGDLSLCTKYLGETEKFSGFFKLRIIFVVLPYCIPPGNSYFMIIL